MQRIRRALVAREGVNCRHVTSLDTDRLVEHIRHRGEAVRRAGRVRDDRMARVQLVVVDTVDQRQIGAGSWRGDQHALGARFQMFRGAFLICEDAGAFHRDIDVEFLPRQLCWSRSAATLILPLPKSIQSSPVLISVSSFPCTVSYFKGGRCFSYRRDR